MYGFNLSISTPRVFVGPWLKVQRANAHIGDLKLEIRGYLERKPYHVFIDRDAQRGTQTPTCEVKEGASSLWGLLVGDAVHNLRSALDHMTNDLVAMNNRKAGGARFPVFADEEGWTKNIKHIKGVSDAHRDQLRALQPYNGGNRRLRDLHLLDIEDKHALLIPAITVVAVRRMSARQRGGGFINVGEMTFDGSKPGKHPLGITVADAAGFEFDNDFDLSADVAFGDINALKGAPVLATLDEMAQAVTAVLTAFTPHTPSHVTVN